LFGNEFEGVAASPTMREFGKEEEEEEEEEEERKKKKNS